MFSGVYFRELDYGSSVGRGLCSGVRAIARRDVYSETVMGRAG